jgi:hypothetical protein
MVTFRILFLESYPLPHPPTSLIINKRDSVLRISLLDEKRFGGGIIKLLPQIDLNLEEAGRGLINNS